MLALALEEGDGRFQRWRVAVAGHLGSVLPFVGVVAAGVGLVRAYAARGDVLVHRCAQLLRAVGLAVGGEGLRAVVEYQEDVGQVAFAAEPPQGVAEYGQGRVA